MNQKIQGFIDDYNKLVDINKELLKACIEAESVIDWLDKSNGSESLDQDNIDYIKIKLQQAINKAK